MGRTFRTLVHPLALAPLALLVYNYVNDNLGANPIQEINLLTGLYALVLLIASLACTPLGLVGLRWAVALRKPLGLYAFLYATLHMLVFVGLDYGFDLGLIWLDVGEKRYIYVGLAAFVILAALAATSTRGAMRRLGKRWKPLHRLVYLAAALAIVHFVWLVKSDIRIPLAYGAAVALLLALRLPPLRRAISRRRPQPSSTPRSPAATE